MNNNEDLRVVKTHMALCNAFMELLEEKCFEDITVSELCDKAMVRRATFYKHFTDKFDFFKFFIIRNQQNIMQECLENKKYTDIKEYFIDVITMLMNFLTQNKNIVGKIWDSNLFSTLLNIAGDELAENVCNTIAPYINKSKEEIHIIIAFYASGLIMTMRLWLRQKVNLTQEELIEKVSEIMQTIPIDNINLQEIYQNNQI